MDVQENLLNWAMAVSVDERLEFLHKYLKVIPAEELGKVIRKAQGAKKRSRRNAVGNDKEKIQALKKKLKVANPADHEIILAEIKTCEERRRQYEEVKAKATQDSAEPSSSGGAQAVSLEAQAVPTEDWIRFPMNDYVPGSRFENYFPTNYVFLDCETVTKNNGTLECGSVALVDHNRKTVYKTNVYHAANSFQTNSFTIKCNGFLPHSLANPAFPKLEEVTEKVQDLIGSKLVILVGGDNGKLNSYNDLISLNLDASGITVYNLHFHFYKTLNEKTIILPMGDEEQAFSFEPISLRRLCMKFFDVDIQSATHDPEIDAFYTAKLFQEILPLKLKPKLQEFVEYDKNKMCAYLERYVDFDDEPKMVELNAKIRAARRKRSRKN